MYCQWVPLYPPRSPVGYPTSYPIGYHATRLRQPDCHLNLLSLNYETNSGDTHSQNLYKKLATNRKQLYLAHVSGTTLNSTQLIESIESL